jgi:hypothetical protein
MHKNFSRKSSTEDKHLEDLGVDERKKLKCFKEATCKIADEINVAHDWNQ